MAYHKVVDNSVFTASVPLAQVYIIHRRDEFRASKIMQNRALANPKIEVLQHRHR